MRRAALLLALALGGCAHAPATQTTSTPVRPVATAASPPPAAPASAAAAAPASAAPSALDAEAARREADAAIAAGRYDEALEKLAPLAGDADARWAVAVLYARATALLYKRDFDGAARVFQQRIERARAQHDAVAEAWLHNAMTWVRWAQHDQPAALDENEQVARSLAALSEKDRREPLLHYWWDRAYLLKELPDKRTLADAARKQYETLARLPDNRDGVAVLAAFFAAREGKGKQALAEARKVDAQKDDDVQDLYVLQLACEAGGDRAGAEAIRGLIQKGNEYPMKPVILQRIEYDRKK